MKKLLLILFVFSFSFVLTVGCSGEETAEPSANASTAEQDCPEVPEVDEEQIVFEEAVGFFNTLPPHKNLIKVPELKENLDSVFVLDIRGEDDFAKVHIPGAVNIPFGKVGLEIDKIPTDKEVIVVCYSGHTASLTTGALKVAGYNARSLIGGYPSWEKAEGAK